MARMPELQNRRQDDAYRFLAASVIERALADLKGIGPKCASWDTDYAMTFILSECCEAWCLELKIDYERIRKEAVGLYQRFIAKTDKETGKKKRARKPKNYFNVSNYGKRPANAVSLPIGR
jgi:hypothetical protein